MSKTVHVQCPVCHDRNELASWRMDGSTPDLPHCNVFDCPGVYVESKPPTDPSVRIADANVRIADALERIASSLEAIAANGVGP